MNSLLTGDQVVYELGHYDIKGLKEELNVIGHRWFIGASVDLTDDPLDHQNGGGNITFCKTISNLRSVAYTEIDAELREIGFKPTSPLSLLALNIKYPGLKAKRSNLTYWKRAEEYYSLKFYFNKEALALVNAGYPKMYLGGEWVACTKI